MTVWRQAELLTIHSVNLNNPMTMKGSYRELIPVPAQRVKIQAAEGMRVAGGAVIGEWRGN